MTKNLLRLATLFAYILSFTFATAISLSAVAQSPALSPAQSPTQSPVKSSAKPLAKSSKKTAVKTAKKPAKKAKAADSVLKEVTKKYRSSKLVKISTLKKVTSQLLGKTTNYEGTMHLSQGKFRWENTTPEQNLLLFDGNTIWNVQYPPKDLGGPVQVAKAKLDKNTKSQILITTLLGTQPIEKNFKVIKQSTQDGISFIELKPLTGDLRVKELTLSIDGKAKLIRNISYKDDVENLTNIELSQTEFLNKEDKSLFKFKIPKDAQVTNL